MNKKLLRIITFVGVTIGTAIILFWFYANYFSGTTRHSVESTRIANATTVDRKELFLVPDNNPYSIKVHADYELAQTQNQGTKTDVVVYKVALIKDLREIFSKEAPLTYEATSSNNTQGAKGTLSFTLNDITITEPGNYTVVTEYRKASDNTNGINPTKIKFEVKSNIIKVPAIVPFFGALLIGGSLVFMVHQLLTHKDTPAQQNTEKESTEI